MTPHHGEQFNRRFGLALFFVYLAFYGAFVYLSAFRSDLMAAHAFAGVNLAVLYGFGLIAAALLLALVYLKVCVPVDESASPGSKS